MLVRTLLLFVVDWRAVGQKRHDERVRNRAFVVMLPFPTRRIGVNCRLQSGVNENGLVKAMLERYSGLWIVGRPGATRSRLIRRDALSWILSHVNW